ncbi:DUF2508 family protein [Fuchsiella alkaliacetigena]|uniref:DUF2508 family protein n=1 Tax=Fuchsiella alkaliacetigena TaxID=957042 RepID=UPI00200AD3F6|nr:DUF2508 family protein [Fuchsiella alkaliacetigena]MCK8824510.1 YaaL family protein [Fuchsiella alkaliacetigena]
MLSSYYQGLKVKLVILDLDEFNFTIDEELEAAKKEWLEAQAYFQKVKEPDLVDYAIYSIEAAQAKYNYLLKEVKKKGHR